MRVRIGFAAGGLAGLLALMSSTAAAAAAPTALWHMNETSGTTMTDSSGHGYNGTISNVKLGVAGVSGTGYQFNGSTSRVIVPDAPGLDAGSANFIVTVNVAFTSLPADDYDLVRKGLASTNGGDWKMEIMPVNGQGIARCYWRGTAGSKTKTAGPNLADGRYHTISCRKTSTTIALIVDGTTYSSTKTIGSIDNSAPISVGAKAGSGGDWYKGRMDEVSLTIG
jgi:hypothetical protein